MKGLNLIIVLLLDLSIPGANDVQNILPHEFIFVSRPCEDAIVPVGCVVARRPIAAHRSQLLKVLKLCSDINKQHTVCGNMRLHTEDRGCKSY